MFLSSFKKRFFQEIKRSVYKTIITANMNQCKVLKRKSQESAYLECHHRKTSQLWGRRNTIFGHSNRQLFDGLLALTKNAVQNLNQPLSATITHKDNPFLRAKLKALEKRQNKEDKDDKQNTDGYLIRVTQENPLCLRLKISTNQDDNQDRTFLDTRVTTMKEVTVQQKSRKREILKCLTDRVN